MQASISGPLRLLSLLLLAAAFLVLAALWVPVNPQLMLTNPVYYQADILRAFEPRSLMGTLGRLLYLSPQGFILLIQLFHVLWAALILWGLSSPGDEEEPAAPLWAVGLVGFLFVFNTPIFLSNVNSGLVDIPAFTMTLAAVLILFKGNRAPTPGRLAGAVAAMIVGILIHEKGIFDATIIGVWLLWRGGWRRSLLFYVPVAGFYAFFILINASAKNAHNWTPSDYFAVLAHIWDYLAYNSFNVYGIILAGGMLWVLLGMVAYRFWRQGRIESVSEGWCRLLVVVAMVGLCLGPLAVAWDTNRLAALMWLPTFLLVRQTRLVPGLATARAGVPVAILCLLHVFVPPAFALRMGAVPINCYAQEVYMALFRTYTKDFESYPRMITLRIGDQPAFTKGNRCWPPHLIR